MPEFRYLMAFPVEWDYASQLDKVSPVRQLTMLASDDLDADVAALEAEAGRVGWQGDLLIARWVSTSGGTEWAEDDRNRFQHQVRETEFIVGEVKDGS